MSFGRDPLEKIVWIHFECHDDAKEFKNLFRKGPGLKFEDTTLYLNFPRWGRDKVLAIFANKARACLVENLDKFSIQESDVRVGPGTGFVFVKSAKIGQVLISESPDEHGKHGISFLPWEREAKTINFDTELFKKTYEVFIASST